MKEVPCLEFEPKTVAFGGFSEYSNVDLGKAIAGNINRKGLLDIATISVLCMEAASQEVDRWHDVNWKLK